MIQVIIDSVQAIWDFVEFLWDQGWQKFLFFSSLLISWIITTINYLYSWFENFIKSAFEFLEADNLPENNGIGLLDVNSQTLGLVAWTNSFLPINEIVNGIVVLFAFQIASWSALVIVKIYKLIPFKAS